MGDVSAGQTGFYAVAEWWDPQTRNFTLTVHRRSDRHERWGDVVKADSAAAVPGAATARLGDSVPYRVVGPWKQTEHGWMADAEAVSVLRTRHGSASFTPRFSG